MVVGIDDAARALADDNDDDDDEKILSLSSISVFVSLVLFLTTFVSSFCRSFVKELLTIINSRRRPQLWRE